MEQAVKGSGREGHAFLRRAEALRPFQTQALAQRPDSTRQYWKKFWTEEDISRDLTEIEMQVRTLAIEQAQSLKPISSTQLYKQVQLMGNKKPGPDQWTPAELRKLPKEAFSGLAFFFGRIEQTGRWPAQAMMQIISMLPNSLKSERPLATCFNFIFLPVMDSMPAFPFEGLGARATGRRSLSLGQRFARLQCFWRCFAKTDGRRLPS